MASNHTEAAGRLPSASAQVRLRPEWTRYVALVRRIVHRLDAEDAASRARAAGAADAGTDRSHGDRATAASGAVPSRAPDARQGGLQSGG